MKSDTRSRNEYFKSEDIYGYVKEYAKAIQESLARIPQKQMIQAQNTIRMTLARSGRIFVGGNGGSAAIADHLKCDFEKGTTHDKTNNLIVHSLNGSMATFSAIGNDLGYEKTLSYQLELSRLTSKDCLILISSSGNSPNILDAAAYAKVRHADLIGLTGFDGGRLKEMADVKLHVPFNNYGIVEDCHQAIMHILAQFHYLSVNNV